MKKVRGLAVIGAVLALFSACLSFQIGFQFTKFGEFAPPEDPEAYAAIMAEPISSTDIWLLIPASLCAAGGILGLIAAAIAGKSPRSAGLMLIISSVICVFTAFGITASILFILGAIFSFFPKAPPDAANLEAPGPTGAQKAAAALCVIGTTLSVSISLISAVLGAYVLFPNDSVIYSLPPDNSNMINAFYLSWLIFGILGFIGGILGVFSCFSIQKSAKKAGILMIFAAVLCIGICYLIPTILLAISAVLMFRAARSQAIVQPENAPADSQ